MMKPVIERTEQEHECEHEQTERYLRHSGSSQDAGRPPSQRCTGLRYFDLRALDVGSRLAIVPNENSDIAMSILTLAEKPATEQIAAIEKGFPSRSLNEVAKMLGLSKQRIIASLKFAQRTVSQREKTGVRFTLEESERLLRVLRVRRIAREVFTTDEAVAQWLNTPDRSLRGKAPLDMLATDVGAVKVENLARAMMHGVPV